MIVFKRHENIVHIHIYIYIYFFFFFFFHFWWHCMACGILVPYTGIEPVPSAVKAWCCNYCVAREFPKILYFKATF